MNQKYWEMKRLEQRFVTKKRGNLVIGTNFRRQRKEINSFHDKLIILGELLLEHVDEGNSHVR